MLGVALEGGGARGAFHIGAIKALMEEGYKIDGIVGTSIGAFNAAMFAQGDFQECEKLWIDVTPEMLFDIENQHMENIVNKNLDRKTIYYFSGEAKKIILNKGIDTNNLRKVVDDLIDEEKLRKSNIDFGLVTVELGPINPVKVFKEDIPNGKIKDFIMASARYPGLKMEPLDGKTFLDGGIYDNCPVSLLVNKNYDEIIAIRLNCDKRLRHIDENANVIEIQPSMNLGGSFVFTQEIARRNIKLGYYDTLKVIKKLKGREYYIEPADEDFIFSKLLQVPDEIILDVGESMGLRDIQPKRMLFEFIIPNIFKYLNLSLDSTYQDFVIALFEEMAKERDLEKFKIYTLSEFIYEIRNYEKVIGFDNKINISIRGLKRLAIENLTKVNVELISDKLLDIIELKENN